MDLRGASRMSSTTLQMVCDRADAQAGFLTLSMRRSPMNAVTNGISQWHINAV